MSSDSVNPLGERGKAKEDEYFHKLNQELAKKLKAGAQLQEVGIDNKELAEKLTKVGYSTDSARALFLIPLIEVAWSDAKTQFEEKEAVLELAQARGIEEGSEAFQLIKGWLEKRPTNDEQFKTGQALIGEIVADVQKKEPHTAGWILEAAQQVAQATGGVFGIGSKISENEKKALERITERLPG